MEMYKMDKQKAISLRQLIMQIGALQKEFNELTGQRMEVSGNVIQMASYVQGFLDAYGIDRPKMEVIEPIKE